ncbi:putative alpha/Beta hydrolase [Rosa chinensis]|uniref:Putative alpha/Beta hydrolase n=1 Tax=Rosa chinensis TaxID=74649 RepID=A0A2P6S023_ROSCH|nr:uncharacterized protein LOC112188031 [Rosa chinensis]PRQ52037.1 putative alpha/Beta hydrolase [Rosa chinensis]
MWNRGNKSKAYNGPQNRFVAFLVVSVTLVTLVFIMLFHNTDQKPSSVLGLRMEKWNSFESLVQLSPTVDFRNGTDVIWQIPDSPKAVLFLAHGCDGRAANFWDKSSTCPNCVGLPEERLIALHALARKFAVLTISSKERCWTFGKEIVIVKDIITWWVKRNKLEKLPLVALGASSGGYFVSVLATELKFSSITLMIAEGMFDHIDIKENYPPTLFVHMPKDLFRQKKIAEYMEVLKNNGVDVEEIECMEFPLSPHLLANRIPGLDQSVSAKLFDLFRHEGFIDENGYMKNDGRRTHWKEAVRKSNIIFPDKQLAHYIQEELNLAFAVHEMTSLHSDRIVKWFESHMR